MNKFTQKKVIIPLVTALVTAGVAGYGLASRKREKPVFSGSREEDWLFLKIGKPTDELCLRN